MKNFKVVEVTNFEENTISVHIEFEKFDMNIPAAVSYEKENGKWILDETGWIDRYEIDKEQLKNMIFESNKLRMLFVTGMLEDEFKKD